MLPKAPPSSTKPPGAVDARLSDSRPGPIRVPPPSLSSAVETISTMQFYRHVGRHSPSFVFTAAWDVRGGEQGRSSAASDTTFPSRGRRIAATADNPLPSGPSALAPNVKRRISLDTSAGQLGPTESSVTPEIACDAFHSALRRRSNRAVD